MPQYFILADEQYLTRDELLDKLANNDYPEHIRIEGIVDQEHPESVSYIFARGMAGYSYSQMEVMLRPGLGAHGAMRGVGFEYVRDEIIDIMDGFGPNAVVIVNPPQHQAPAAGNVQGNQPGVNPGPGFLPAFAPHDDEDNFPNGPAQVNAPQNAPQPAVTAPAVVQAPLPPQPANFNLNLNNNNMSVNNNNVKMKGGRKRRTQRRRTMQRRRKATRRRRASYRRF